MNQDFLYHITQYTFIEDTWLVEVVRFVIASISFVIAALVAKLYKDHKYGMLSRTATIGVLLIYLNVGYAQIVSMVSPYAINGITTLNVFVLIAVIVSLVGVLQIMKINLFKKRYADEPDAE